MTALESAERAAQLAAKTFYDDPTPANFDAMRAAEAEYRARIAEAAKAVMK